MVELLKRIDMGFMIVIGLSACMAIVLKMYVTKGRQK